MQQRLFLHPGIRTVPAMLGYRPQRMQCTVPGRAIGVNLILSRRRPGTRFFKWCYPLTS